ncbi:dynein axonemal heavy chain 12-like [Polistes fuscatus]|uniref:dynein axonemal heavy chain 12-like n=1 Tax=Polistes fuscatus TaxID=30207 RepID=UPI001CA81166|nr:dynein axonemal heavy chain 12-like [Polistes fuscatus]
MSNITTEFYDLINKKMETPRLSEITNVLEFKDVRKENPLSMMKLDKIATRKVQDMIEEASKKAKIFRYDDILAFRPIIIKECDLGVSENKCFVKMKQYAEKIPTLGLLDDWEKRIRMLVTSKLQEKYKDIFEEDMKEVKNQYYQAIYNMSVNSVVATECQESCNILDYTLSESFKLPDPPDFSTIYQKRRYNFAKRYYFPHKFMRNIVARAYTVFGGNSICDFRRYRKIGILDLNRLLDLLDADLKRGALLITSSYYGSVIRNLSQSRYLYDVPMAMINDFFRCATNLLSLQIMACMMNTIEEWLTVLNNCFTAPLLKLELKCENNELFVLPLLSEIYQSFQFIIDEIANVAQELPTLESWIGMKTVHKVISVTLPKWYLDEVHKRLEKILTNLFQPVIDYIEQLREQFGLAYDIKTRRKIIAYVAEGHTFEECVERVEDFNRLVREINGLPNTEHFFMATIHQTDGKIALMSYTQYGRELIIGELVKRHRNYNLEICNVFETMKKKALNVPETTKELLELGKYMLVAASTTMEEMNHRITLSLNMMASLIGMTSLSVDHVDLNNITVNWLKRIRPIFEQSSSMYEQMKFELEENLQSKVLALNTKVEKMFPRLTIMNDMDDAKRVIDYIEDLRKLMRGLDRMDEQAEWINSEEALFNFPLSEYHLINELKDIIMPFYEMIYQACKWQRFRDVCLDGPFEYLDGYEVDAKCNEFFANFIKMSKQYRTKIKLQLATNYPYSFKGLIEDPDPFQQPAPIKLAYQINEDIKWFKVYVPLVTVFCNPALRQHHWDEMSIIAGFDLTPNAGTTLRKMIFMDLLEDLEKYELISVSASKELSLEQAFHKILKEWDDVFFETMLYKDSGVEILTQLDDIQTLLEEHIVKIQTMRGSAFVKQIKNEVEDFYQKLLRIRDTIEEWTKVQVQWMYLLPIFSSKDIVAQLPEENVLFVQVDGIFRNAMQAVKRDHRVRETAGSVGLLEVMREANSLMETVNDGIYNYLEKKRLFFPRFFFLSNDDMLEILSETKDPLRVQPHLKKCFEGISRLGFNETLEIYSMISDEKEEIMLQNYISTEAARGCVEKWLIQVEEYMIKSIRHEMLLSYLDYDTNERVVWVQIWPGMIVLCVAQIYWSMEVQSSLLTLIPSTMEALYEKLQLQILDMVNLVKGKLTKQNRITLNALITIDVHAMDIVKMLVDKQIMNEKDFEWLAQLRYYWEDDVFVRIIHATIPYAYEYIGNTSRLVITPLTDRCYRTLIGAYTLHLNGAPEGPAGTGKTETVKDLSRALAVQCIVFNCSEGLDYKNMGKFFKGLAACGAWSCFDEFNRIELEVLSVVAQQILSIVQAVRANLEKFVFEGTELQLNPAVYICITMNPGYAGRSELPDNLKVLFRTVAMMVPDYAMIAEIFLYSSGFNTARALSTKIVATYKLCSEQLSTQSHYDYGMRAVKSVLTAAQNIKLKFPDEDEAILLLRSIIDVNLPKFLAHDIPLFQGIVSDLFPGLTLPAPSYDVLLAAVHEVAKKRNLQAVDTFLLKIIQTYEMMIVRHGFMLVGEPFGGKTSVLHTLADALTLMHDWKDENGAVTKYFTINPKSITLEQLYGHFDPVSSEWSDGVCAVAFREYSMEETDHRKWIIFDGPVDALWIENLNTVLDDNKKLCLTSGEVMQMSNVMSMIFEVMDLVHASPATVSRCGMIYVEPRVLGWQPFIDSWIARLNPQWKEGHEDLINELFQWLLDPCLEFIRKTCHMYLNVGQIHQVVSTLNLIEMFMETAVADNPKVYGTYIVPWLQAAMLLGLVWGAGGTLDFDSRCKFNAFYLTFWTNENKDYPMPESIEESLISIPVDELIHDHFYTFKGRGSWRRLADLCKSERYDDTQSISNIMIPTIDTVKYQLLFLMHIKHRKRFLIQGGTGTGKSFYIKDLLMNKLEESKYLPNFIVFTPNTTAWTTQELVLTKLYKRQRNQFGPLPGTQCIVFIDEVNMPAKETFGSQSAIELLRQFFDHGSWYDLKKPEKIWILDTMFICAMAPPGGSRQEIYQRFLRHFNLYSISKFSTESVTRIFTSIAFIGLKRNGFTTSIIPIINEFVNATMVIYKAISKEFRPTPAKPHYSFNLRDFTRVILGFTLIKKESAETKNDLTKLWVHEILRVFGDRLVEATDHRWLFHKIKDTTQSVLKESFDTTFNHLPKFQDNLTEESFRSLIYGNFMNMEVLADERLYEEILSITEYREVALAYLEEYNNTHRKKIDIVMFRYALEHLARICRVLAISNSSLLMIGVSGSGRQSLTKLASNMAGHGLFQPEIGSAYGLNEWREDIKKVLKNSGGVGKNFVFLFTEGQIKEEAFLADIDSLLNIGEVPNLFTIEERQEIIEMCRLDAQGGNRNLDISVLAVLAFFINRCKEMLHIMLCFSPIGDTFRIRLRLYPSLVNCCTIDWFEVWPEDALEQIALHNVANINVNEDVKVNAVIACKYFHNCAKDISDHFYKSSGRITYITTASFLDLMRTYVELIGEKQEELTLARDRYLNGLNKLEYAAEQIQRMREVLSELRPQLELSAKVTTETMKQIETENVSVEKATILVKRDEDAANVQAKIAENLKLECEADLAQALPALDEAIAALNTLKPADISVVKTMTSPPEGVKLVMAAVCVMMGIPPVKVDDPITGRKIFDYWIPSKRFLGDMKFLDTLRQYDKDNIPTHIMDEIKKTYMTDKNFEPRIIAKASSAAEGLCKWVRAMVLYDEVIKEVAPKKAKLAAAQTEYEKIMAFLNERRQMLADLTEKLAYLNERLQTTLTKKLEMENEVTNCRNKLVRAEKLIDGLGGEKDRWLAAAANLKTSYDTLPGDILISCGVIAYLGPFTASYRMENIDKWKTFVQNLNIPCSLGYNFVEILGTEIKINSWNIFGLPRDPFSIENAIIMDNSKRWSLFIDPQSQANKWIRHMEKQSELEIIKVTDKNYMNIIEQAVQYGKPVLIENILEDLPAPLDPILMKNIYNIAGIWHITLGETAIEYDLRFRLYITTKLRNPHYLPDVFNKITLINFALTIEGLEDQLLEIVVAKERPDLQEKREYLIIESAANKRALKQVEDNILKTLSIAGGGILEDEEAIEILDSSKILSIDILKKQDAAKKTEKSIEVFRQSYQPIAKYSSALYYTITDLPNIDPMYEFSLQWFINLYVVSIDLANKSKVLERRLGFLKNTFTYHLYQNVCRSLFEKDKILYSFVLYSTILLASNQIDKQEFLFFLSGGMALKKVTQNPAPDWLSDKSWAEIDRIDTLPSFGNFSQNFIKNLTEWKIYYDLLNPEKESLPEPWENALTYFQKLIVMRMIRPDKIIIAIREFVKDGLGIKFVTPPPFDISKSYMDSTCTVPLIFILSTGSDPMGALTNFADSMDYLSKFSTISLGQGQGPIAQKLITEAQREGLWVCLQNCHLAVSWMPVLEKICEGFNLTNTHTKFRLWLTSYPSDKFPITVLQNGLKMTNEPPTGLQQNIMKCYLSEAAKEPDFFHTSTQKKRNYSKLLYALCFFHALIQERRNYGPQGWNIKYGFDDSDLQISVQQLQFYIDDYEQVPFKAIIYLTGECNYGGRVTDERDRRCLNTILDDFYNPYVITNINYSFADIGPEYMLPKKHEYKDYIEQIEGIPVITPPEVFGLHMNAGITRDLESSKNFFDSMMLIQGTVTVGDIMKQDELLLLMKENIYSKLPDLFDIEEAQKLYPTMYMESMNTVLIQEMERYNILLTEMRNSLVLLERAIKGHIVMTADLEILGAHIINNKVPPSWIRASAYPTLKPLSSFIDDFLKRLDFFKTWLIEGKPKTFWISGFSFVHAFLTAAAQNFARKYKIPIDKINFDFQVMPSYKLDESPIDGVYVYGMYLVGARWDMKNMLLAESFPKVLWESMPIVWFKPSEMINIIIGGRYECPLYITSARFGVLKTTGHSTNYVLSILLDTNKAVSHWIKRGLALLCQLDN